MCHWEQVKLLNHKYDIWNCKYSINRILEITHGQIWSQNCNVPDFYEIQHSEQTEQAYYEYINWNWLPWPKIRNLPNLVPKLKCVSMFIKFGTTANPTSKLWIQYLELIILTQDHRFRQIWFQNWNAHNAYEFWHSELIEYINIYLESYLEFKTWPKILDLGRFRPTFQIWSYFHEVW